MTVAPIEPITVNIAEAAKLLRIGERKTYELMASGEIERLKVGARTVITLASIYAYIDRLRAKAKRK